VTLTLREPEFGDLSTPTEAPSQAPSQASAPARSDSLTELTRAISNEPDAFLDPDADAAIRGDHRAQNALWERHRRWVAAILIAHKPRWAELEDLLQEVALSFVRKVHELRDPRAIKPWLRIVAVNAAHAAARSGKIRPHAVGSFGAEEVDLALEARGKPSKGVFGASPATTNPVGAGSGLIDDHAQSPIKLQVGQESRALLDLASKLADGYREPLLLKAVQNLSYREIGRILDLPETTVETRIARARKQLRILAAEKDSLASSQQPQSQPNRPAPKPVNR
jgi:RNA polymerase sigma factor (sigma-70 family)